MTFCGASTYVIGVVIAMFAMNWKLALLIMIVIPPLAVISVFFQKKILQVSAQGKKDQFPHNRRI